MMPLRRQVNKVLVIPSWYPDKNNPVLGIFVYEQVRCLAKRFDVTVLTPRFPRLRELLQLCWGPELIHEKEHGLKTLRVRHFKMPTLRRRIPFLADPDHALIYYRKFAAAIRKGFARYVEQEGAPDVIHAHVVLPAGWIAVELGERYGIPVVLTEHSGPFAMHLQTETQRRLVREILGKADRLIAVSPALRLAMSEFYPDAKIDVVANLIDSEFFTPAPRIESAGRRFRFLFVGNLVEIKGVCHLLDAVHRLVAMGFQDFEVHLGGDGPLGRSLRKMAADLGIADRCRFLGMLNREAVREQMRACDVFVLPSLGETFGIVNGEAMACGKPVLSTRCGGPEYVVPPEAGILVTPGDAHELAEAMASFLKGERAFDPAAVRASVVERFGEATLLAKTARILLRHCSNDTSPGVRYSEPSDPFFLIPGVRVPHPWACSKIPSVDWSPFR